MSIRRVQQTLLYRTGTVALSDNWRDTVEAFKQQTVYKHIYDREYVIKDNMGEWIHKFISDKDGFREQYDLAMHRALLKEEKHTAFKREEFPETTRE